MAKKVLVEILKTTAWVGRQGEVLELSLPMVTNRLAPQWIVKLARGNTKTWSTHADQIKEVQDNRHNLAEKLHAQTVICTTEVHGEKITHHFDKEDVAKAIKKHFHAKILPEMVSFDDVKHPKKTGIYDIHITVHPEVFIKMKADVRSK